MTSPTDRTTSILKRVPKVKPGIRPNRHITNTALTCSKGEQVRFYNQNYSINLNLSVKLFFEGYIKFLFFLGNVVKAQKQAANTSESPSKRGGNADKEEASEINRK